MIEPREPTNLSEKKKIETKDFEQGPYFHYSQTELTPGVQRAYLFSIASMLAWSSQSSSVLSWREDRMRWWPVKHRVPSTVGRKGRCRTTPSTRGVFINSTNSMMCYWKSPARGENSSALTEEQRARSLWSGRKRAECKQMIQQMYNYILQVE